ncbi:MAG: hypothetical protein O7E52_02265 [Candidatus Poribacteria bacterium]|nr:hypothetical protein [Candidatus Poribacteria bacterium]
MSKSDLVCDTSLLLYLDHIGQVHLLPALFESISVPETVVMELDAGRLLRPDTIDPRTLDWTTVPEALRLASEVEVH